MPIQSPGGMRSHLWKRMDSTIPVAARATNSSVNWTHLFCGQRAGASFGALEKHAISMPQTTENTTAFSRPTPIPFHLEGGCV